MKKGGKHVISTLTYFFQFQRFLFFFNFAKGTTVSRVRFTPFPSSWTFLEGAPGAGAALVSFKKKEGKEKKMRFLIIFRRFLTQFR